MTKWFSFKLNQIEEAHFQPDADGWTFKVPGPWPLAPPKRYLVSEQQRAEILLQLPRIRRRAAVLSLGLLGTSIAIAALGPTIFRRSIIQEIVILFIFMMIGGCGIGVYFGSMLRSLVDGLKAANDQATLHDGVESPGSVAIRWLSLFAGAGLILLGCAALQDILSVDATGMHMRGGSHTHLSMIGTAVVTCAGIYSLVIAAIRRRNTQLRN